MARTHKMNKMKKIKKLNKKKLSDEWGLNPMDELIVDTVNSHIDAYNYLLDDLEQYGLTYRDNYSVKISAILVECRLRQKEIVSCVGKFFDSSLTLTRVEKLSKEDEE